MAAGRIGISNTAHLSQRSQHLNSTMLTATSTLSDLAAIHDDVTW